jgi:prevent-host-death family protein
LACASLLGTKCNSPPAIACGSDGTREKPLEAVAFRLAGVLDEMYNWSNMPVEYTTVPATELREHGSEILNRVAYGDEEVVLTRRGKPIAAIVSLASLETLHRLEDAEDVAEAEAARADVRKRGAIPWKDVKAELRRP